jgi:hypothetical protein
VSSGFIWLRIGTTDALLVEHIVKIRVSQTEKFLDELRKIQLLNKDYVLRIFS